METKKLTSMNVLLTGASGFIGSCFLKKLNLLGIDQVWLTDIASEGFAHANLQGKKFQGYITRDQLFSEIEKNNLNHINLVVHLGACSDTTEKNRTYLQENNTDYSRKLAQWCLAKNKKFHYASSASVYGDGKQGYSDDSSKVHLYKALNLYGESKLLFDQWVIDQKLEKQVVGYRYFNVFGPNEYHKGDMRSLVSKAYDQLAAGERVKLFATSRAGYGDGSEERDFVYVKDVIDVMAYFLEHPDRGGIFNLGTGQPRSFKDLALAVYLAMNKKPDIEYIPMPEKLKGQYQYWTCADLEKLKNAGYNKPFLSLENSVKDYVHNHLSQKIPIY
ncbi:MAG: ADP-glyceromanno-heptose 6-epimerase [Elusimicrobiota bacterium]